MNANYTVDVDDQNRGDLPAPDLATLQSAMAQCFITVVALDSSFQDHQIPFVKTERTGVFAIVCEHVDRPLPSSQYYTAHVATCYEWDYPEDGDPDGEVGFFGVTEGITYNIVEDPVSMVFYEPIEDSATADGAFASYVQVVAHEVGHHFGLEDDETGSGHLMAYQNSGSSFRDEDKGRIRMWPYPGYQLP